MTLTGRGWRGVGARAQTRRCYLLRMLGAGLIPKEPRLQAGETEKGEMASEKRGIARSSRKSSWKKQETDPQGHKGC